MATADLPNVIDEPLYEIVRGVKVEVPAMGAWAGTIATLLATHLNYHANEGGLGLAVVEVLFELMPGGNHRRPDVAFITADKWTNDMTGPDDPPVYQVVPDIAVEVNSPTNSAAEIEDKVQEYLAAGVRLVWVIYPRARRVHCFSAPNQARILRDKDVLDGGAVLPDFRLELKELFHWPGKL